MQKMFNNISTWLRKIADLGVTLLVVLLTLDILFPNSTGVVANISTLSNHFPVSSQTGLVAVLLFLLLFSKLKK